MELHILLAGVEFGPYTVEQARELLGEGFLSATDPAKRLDETDWLPLNEVLAQLPVGAPAAQAPEGETFAGEEEATPSAPAIAEEEPADELPPTFEWPVPEEPEEISAEEPSELSAANEEIENSEAETETPADTPPVIGNETNESSAPTPVEESPSIEAPTKEESIPAPTLRPVISTSTRRELTAAEKTSFLLPVTGPPSPIASTTPLLQVSLPSKAKKSMRTGSLLAQEALRAARGERGVLSPSGAPVLDTVAPEQPAPPVVTSPATPAAAPEPVEMAATPPRRKISLILRDREETTSLAAVPSTPETIAESPTTTQRKAIRLTGRITLPGIPPKPVLPPSQSPSISGPLVISRPPRTGVGSRREPSRSLSAREKSSFLIGQIARPADVARKEIASEMREVSDASVQKEKTSDEISALSETKDQPSVPPMRVAAETVAEEPAVKELAPGYFTTLLQAAGTETVAEPPTESGALPSFEEPIMTDPTASGPLTASGDLAERRSLKITGPLRHPSPRPPIRLSSPSQPGDSSRLPYSTSERVPTSSLPSPEAPAEPLPPAPEESLPPRPQTGKIPVSAMPTEGVRIRTRHITSKVTVPPKEPTPEPFSVRVTPPRPLPETPVETVFPLTKSTPMSITPPLAETGIVVPPPAESIPVKPTVPTEDIPASPDATAAAATAAVTPSDAPPMEPSSAAPATPDKIRLRRPVKLELSSRAKIQESGRLTLEAFSKMASLDLPGKPTPTDVEAPSAQAASSAEATTPTAPSAQETPADTFGPVSPPGPLATPTATDYDQPRLEEAPPLVWKSVLPKTRWRWEWLAYAIITIGVVAICAIVYIVAHRSSNVATASAESVAATNEVTATNETSAPPTSAAPPTALPTPASAPSTVAPTPTPSTASVPPTPPANATLNASIQDLNRQVDAYVGDGLLKYQHGDFAGALAADNQAIDLDPKSATALFNRGVVKAAQNDLDGAVADYSAALQLDPNMAAAYYRRGLARHSKAELDGALSDYNQALQIDPKNPQAFFNRGMIRMQKDDIDGAVVDSTRALELDPHFIPSYYNRGLGRLAKGSLDGALSDLKTYCQLAPQDVYTDYARLYIWLTESQQGRLADANQELAKAMNSGWNGAATSMVTRIGEFLLGQLDENELIKLSASPIPVKDQGQRCEAWYFIGMRLLLAGDKPGAIEDLRKCVGTQKTDYCEYILAQEELKKLSSTSASDGAVSPPRAQAVTLPDPGTVTPNDTAPDSAPDEK